MSRYGTDMTVTGIFGEIAIRGFFQAVNTKSWQSMESVASPMGAVIHEGDTLTLGSKSYVFRRVEPYYYQNQPLYQWGLCVEKGVNDTWGIRSLS